MFVIALSGQMGIVASRKQDSAVEYMVVYGVHFLQPNIHCSVELCQASICSLKR